MGGKGRLLALEMKEYMVNPYEVRSGMGQGQDNGWLHTMNGELSYANRAVPRITTFLIELGSRGAGRHPSTILRVCENNIEAALYLIENA